MRAAILVLFLSAGASPEPGQVTSSAPAAAPAAAAASILRSAVAIEATQRLPLAPDGDAVVDPRATFEIELSARVPDARLVLVDARDDLVPSTSASEISATTRLTLAPAVPLVPASRYALRLDGGTGRDLHDEGGRAFAPLTLPILVAGTPPPPEPKQPVRRKKRR